MSSTLATTFTIPSYTSSCQTKVPDTTPASKPSKPLRGSFEHDQGNLYALSWPSMAAMHAWRCKEEQEKSIELSHKELWPNTTIGEKVWNEKHIFVCAQKGLGGNNSQHYTKKHNWTRKIESKLWLPSDNQDLSRDRHGPRIISRGA
jgi:hypothetical protein